MSFSFYFLAEVLFPLRTQDELQSQWCEKGERNTKRGTYVFVISDFLDTFATRIVCHVPFLCDEMMSQKKVFVWHKNEIAL